MIHLKMAISSSITVKSRVIGISIPRTGRIIQNNYYQRLLSGWGGIFKERESSTVSMEEMEISVRIIRRFRTAFERQIGESVEINHNTLIFFYKKLTYKNTRAQKSNS